MISRFIWFVKKAFLVEFVFSSTPGMQLSRPFVRRATRNYDGQLRRTQEQRWKESDVVVQWCVHGRTAPRGRGWQPLYERHLPCPCRLRKARLAWVTSSHGLIVPPLYSFLPPVHEKRGRQPHSPIPRIASTVGSVAVGSYRVRAAVRWSALRRPRRKAKMAATATHATNAARRVGRGAASAGFPISLHRPPVPVTGWILCLCGPSLPRAPYTPISLSLQHSTRHTTRPRGPYMFSF
jgi:hypothetical protein